MNDMARYCRAIEGRPGITQRELARRLHISVGKVNSLVGEAEALGYVSPEPRSLTDSGLSYLEGYRVKNAILFASGIDVRFVPFTHDTPKCLMELEGERIIERVIRQLQARGITDITVVVGYLAEKFDYLVDAYGVELCFNPDYAEGKTLASLYHVRDRLGDTYLVNADQWIWQNIFHTYEPDSWCAAHWQEGTTRLYTAETNGHKRIVKMKKGGRDKLSLLGPVYLTKTAAAAMLPILERAYAEPELETEDWERAVSGKLREVELHVNILPQGLVQEFQSFDELRDFDVSYAEVSGNAHMRRIAEILAVPESAITDMRWLDIGMTNQSFVFRVGDNRYIYRIPGEGTESFISRRQEAAVYKAVTPLQISDEVLYIDPVTGIKITKYYPNSHNVAEDSWEDIVTCMGILKKLHASGASVKYRFDIEERLRSYDTMCKKVDCIHFEDYEDTIKALRLPLDIIAATGDPLVLCHIDAVTNNFLVTQDGSIRLLDWEYGGMCHALADIAMFGVFSVYDAAGLDRLLAAYFGRPATREERLLCYSYAAAAGILWSIWAEFRQYHGEDFGEYAVSMYRLGKNFTRLVHRMRENPDETPATQRVRKARVAERGAYVDGAALSEVLPVAEQDEIDAPPAE